MPMTFDTWVFPRLNGARGAVKVTTLNVATVAVAVKGRAAGAAGRGPLGALIGSLPTSGAAGAAGGSQAAASAEKLAIALRQRVEEKVRAEYKKLTAAAKREGAKRVNEMVKDATGVDLGLTGNESFDEVARKVGAGLGASAGGAIGTSLAGPLGGAIGAKLGAIAGGFLGSKIGPLVEDAWKEVSAYLEGAAADAYEAVKDWFGGGGSLTAEGWRTLTGGRGTAEQFAAAFGK